MPAPGGAGVRPELPTWSETTVSVSTTASMIGSQCARSHSEGSPISCGRSGKVTDVKPRSALRRISATASVGVGQVGDPERHDALGVRRVPLLEEPVVPGPDAGQAEVAVLGVEEDAAAEAGDHGREVHRGPHAVDVHVAHPGVDVVAAGTHLVEAEGLQAVASRAGVRPPRSCRPGCSARPRTPTPGDPPASRRCAGPGPASAAGSRPSNVCGGLDDVVVDRDHRVAHLPGLGLGEEEIVRRARSGVCPRIASGAPRGTARVGPSPPTTQPPPGISGPAPSACCWPTWTGRWSPTTRSSPTAPSPPSTVCATPASSSPSRAAGPRVACRCSWSRSTSRRRSPPSTAGRSWTAP